MKHLEHRPEDLDAKFYLWDEADDNLFKKAWDRIREVRSEIMFVNLPFKKID